MDPLHRVIDAAYGTALDHSLSVSFAAALKALPEDASHEHTLQTHLARAREIASRQKAQRPELPFIELNGGSEPARLSRGCPVNAPRDIQSLTSELEQTLPTPSSWEAVSQWIATQSDGRSSFRLSIEVRGTHQSVLPAIVEFTAEDKRHTRITFLPLVQLSDTRLQADLSRLLGLRSRQSEVALGITQGLSAEDIARTLNISANTVRHYAKEIYNRLGVRKQVEVANIVSQLQHFRQTPLGMTSPKSGVSEKCFMRMTNFITSPQTGRRVSYSDCGDSNGTPCLMFHSTFGGRWVWDRTAQSFCDAGLRLIIVDRPSIGLTDAATEDRHATSIQDAIDVLDHLAISKAHGLSFSMGSFVLSGAMQEHPDRFLSAAFITPRAFTVTTSTPEDTDPLLKIFSGLPIDAAAIIHQALEAAGPEESLRGIINMLFADNPEDLEAMKDEDMFQMHVEQFRNGIAVSAEGLSHEWRDNGLDFPPPQIPHNIPSLVVSGELDNLAWVREGAKDWSSQIGKEPLSLKGAGHLIFLTHTEELIDAIGLNASM